MLDIATGLVAGLTFLALAAGYASLSAAWERVGQRGTGRLVGRVAAIGGHDRLGE